MLTKKDLQLIAELYNETRKEFASMFDRLRKEMREEMGQLREEIKNRIYKSEDKILKELQDMRDNSAVTSGYSDRLEDHDERIEILEKQVLVQ
ncbi:MAG: hypothetical protein Q8Q65_00630 [bacterium]|nr:hypothetical protein [bacterium]